jgi:hypothetical protein
MSPTVQRRPTGLALVAATPQVEGELGAQRKTFGPADKTDILQLSLRCFNLKGKYHKNMWPFTCQ